MYQLFEIIQFVALSLSPTPLHPQSTSICFSPMKKYMTAQGMQLKFQNYIIMYY